MFICNIYIYLDIYRPIAFHPIWTFIRGFHKNIHDNNLLIVGSETNDIILTE